MTDTVKGLNQTKEILQTQNIHLIEKITELELQLRQTSLRQQTQSSPSPSKMDETGVHSLLNAKKSIVPDLGTTSPVQTVAGKDISNPLMAVTLPKSEEEPSSSKTRRKLPQTFTGSTSRARSRRIKKGQNKTYVMSLSIPCICHLISSSSLSSIIAKKILSSFRQLTTL
ncbi:hypothetical protein RND71_037114 [Anisodus tanguticus]|uniref:Uncharacterized protein n=1 Tax=Anisodus tanguticus TaxID=243964 RepID=A0AAE1V0Z5_9SOLA|nr:hypothetical protein RND71_037114 [Anisodus tanguticus]